MDYSLIWSVTAQIAFEQAVQFIALDRPAVAGVFRARVHGLVDQLIQQPLIGAVLESNRSPNTRELFCEPYRIFYRVDQRNRIVSIVNLWHASRDEPTRADLLG